MEVLWTAVPGDLGDKVPRPPPPQGPPRGPLGGKNASCPERLPQPALAPVRGSAASPQAVRPGGLRRPRPERVSPSPSLEPLARPPPPSPPPVKRSFARPRVRSPGTLEGPAVLRLSGPAVPLLPAEPSPVPRSAGPRVGEGTVWESAAGARAAGGCRGAGAGRARGRAARCPPPQPREPASLRARRSWAHCPRGSRWCSPLSAASLPSLRLCARPLLPPHTSREPAAGHGGGAGAAALDGAPRRAECAAPRLAPPGPGAQLHGARAAAASRRGGRLLQPPGLAGQSLLRQSGPRAGARLLQPSARPPHRRPDVPATLVAQPGFALAGWGQSSPFRCCRTPPQPLDREPLLQDSAAPLGCRRARRPALRVSRDCRWEWGRQRELCGLSHPHCSPLWLPPLWLPTHTAQRSVP
ncbi:endothelial transcription factor GATA-2 isoform X3 [Castor canadensis]|uniref:Endothelial transcription factor GATA-2 isoform X3 n=1 Tax=Castor canadensis TaxID=51338 RepID=A0AC58K745_CASCN